MNAIHASEETFFYVRKIIFNSFPNSNFVFTAIKVKNVVDANERLNIITNIHNRAHRQAKNNFQEALRMHFWPQMKGDFVAHVKKCEICNTQKYERVPAKQPIGSTPIPKAVGESISMDLFYIDNKPYVTSVDRFLKYLLIHLIQNKINFLEKLEEILTQNYPNCKSIITDNEAVLISNAAKTIYQKYGITHVTTPVQHSTSNGQVERTHSTLIELIRSAV